MGICLDPAKDCCDKTVNIYNGINVDNPKELNNNVEIYKPKKIISDVGTDIKITLVFLCSDNIQQNHYTYKFRLYIDNSGKEEENFTYLGSTETMASQSQLQFKKIFYTRYFFSKEQIIKISCLQNEKEIKNCSFYLSKMINGFETPKLIIEKENRFLGKLLIFIKKEDEKKNKFKKVELNISLKNYNLEEDVSYFFVIESNEKDLLYKSEDFIYKKNNDERIFFFNYVGRKNLVFLNDKDINIILYAIKNNIQNKEIVSNITDQSAKEKMNEDGKVPNNKTIELIGATSLSNLKLLNNNGINEFKMHSGYLSVFFKEPILIEIKYTEKDYTPFIEYINLQLHLNLIIILDKFISEENTKIANNIIQSFNSILSLYNTEEPKYISINIEKNPILKKSTFFKVDASDKKDQQSKNDETIELANTIEIVLQNFIRKEIKMGHNKYYVIIVFTDKLITDLKNNDVDKIEEYLDIPFNIKVFYFGNKKNNIENNSSNKKYKREVIQFYDIDSNIKNKNSDYLNDVPLLIEDFFEMQKSTKFTIFGE